MAVFSNLLASYLDFFHQALMEAPDVVRPGCCGFNDSPYSYTSSGAWCSLRVYALDQEVL
ncbi:hypothetical protein E2C01_085644 [Portunus trituberculatus]|uniref:Uncharacterized protein n=1 Tax=Portunus trituberculatus TaxID=210409 RepID=A0A5B7JB90_PORTR|nr:hypothetical protein [Portunus trituberculatus]